MVTVKTEKETPLKMHSASKKSVNTALCYSWWSYDLLLISYIWLHQDCWSTFRIESKSGLPFIESVPSAQAQFKKTIQHMLARFCRVLSTLKKKKRHLKELEYMYSRSRIFAKFDDDEKNQVAAIFKIMRLQLWSSYCLTYCIFIRTVYHYN